MRHEIISPTHTLSKYEKNNVYRHPKELYWTFYRHVFANICYVLQNSRIRLEQTLIPLLIVIQEINMVSNCSDKYEEYPVKTTWQVIILRSAVTDENARKCAFARFFIKCLLWHETYAKWIWDDLEQFKNLRAHWRADIRACARFFKLILIGRILTLIMINMNEERLSVMKICSWVDFHKMAPRWRHGDLESLKSHAVLS